jgi:hypothetical protein
VIPDGGWTIAADPDSSPWAAIVVDAVTPSPSPSTPSPGLVVGDEESNADAYSEGDERGRNDGAGAGRDVDGGGVVLRDVDYLRLSGLNDVDGLIGDLLDFNLLLLVGAEGSGGVGLAAEALDGCGDLGLVGGHGLADGGVVVDVVGHHLKHGWEGHEGEEGGIEALFLRGVGEGGAGEVRVLGEPVGDVEDFLWVCGGGCDLREKLVRI